MTEIETKQDEVRTCLYCGQDFLESTSTAEDKESYCNKDHEEYDSYLLDEEDDDDEEDEEEEDELKGL